MYTLDNSLEICLEIFLDKYAQYFLEISLGISRVFPEGIAKAFSREITAQILTDFLNIGTNPSEIKF